jgi:pimeloyl-ACP methyl ester carboxylesterase
VPDNYVTFLDGPAEVAGVVLVAPAATHSIGWVPGLDEPTVDAALAAVQAELSIDPRRVAYAGHSSGGAYAIQLAYLEKRNVSAVFSIAAPFRTIGAIVDTANPAPLRMAYGTLDPNYATALPPYEAQWQTLGLAYELDIRPGVGHNSLGTATMNSAFQFLAAQTYGGSLCATLGPAVCLLGERYRVEVGWRLGTGATGVATAQATSNDSVLLSFFAPTNWEMLVKVLDGCASNGHRWVFASAATDVEWTLTVTDSHTGAVASWTNPLGTRSAALTAVDAFPCDPP